MTLIDLRLAYKRATGDNHTPINNGHYNTTEYIVWLEEQLTEQYVKPIPRQITFNAMTDEELFKFRTQ